MKDVLRLLHHYLLLGHIQMQYETLPNALYQEFILNSDYSLFLVNKWGIDGKQITLSQLEDDEKTIFFIYQRSTQTAQHFIPNIYLDKDLLDTVRETDMRRDAFWLALKEAGLGIGNFVTIKNTLELFSLNDINFKVKRILTHGKCDETVCFHLTLDNQTETEKIQKLNQLKQDFFMQHEELPEEEKEYQFSIYLGKLIADWVNQQNQL